MPGSKKGERRGGRKKGTPNKLTADTRAAVAKAFTMIGDVEALAEWAQDHQEAFYTRVWARTIPNEQKHDIAAKVGVVVLPSVNDRDR